MGKKDDNKQRTRKERKERKGTERNADVFAGHLNTERNAANVKIIVIRAKF
jgi:hypothetical protein